MYERGRERSRWGGKGEEREKEGERGREREREREGERERERESLLRYPTEITIQNGEYTIISCLSYQDTRNITNFCKN